MNTFIAVVSHLHPLLSSKTLARIGHTFSLPDAIEDGKSFFDERPRMAEGYFPAVYVKVEGEVFEVLSSSVRTATPIFSMV